MPTSRLGAVRDAMAAIYGLVNVAAVTNLALGGVHHSQAPQGETRAYVLIQSPDSLPWNAMQSPGEDIEFEIVAVAIGPDSGGARAILNAVTQVVDGERPAVTNHLCVALQYLGQREFADPELVNGQTSWRVVGRFRMLADQA